MWQERIISKPRANSTSEHLQEEALRLGALQHTLGDICTLSCRKIQLDTMQDQVKRSNVSESEVSNNCH